MIQNKSILNLKNKFIDSTEIALDEADKAAIVDSRRMSHEEVFTELRRTING